MQLWNLGRAATPSQIRGEGDEFISSSNTPIVAGGEAPKAMTEAEIAQHVSDYATASQNFVTLCGGDGSKFRN